MKVKLDDKLPVTEYERFARLSTDLRGALNAYGDNRPAVPRSFSAWLAEGYFGISLTYETKRSVGHILLTGFEVEHLCSEFLRLWTNVLGDKA